MRKSFLLKISALLLILFFREQVIQAACSFNVSAGTDTTICSNQTIFLNGTVTPAGAYNYQWTDNPVSPITNANSLTPTVTPGANTTYTLSVDNGTCTATATVNVTISGVGITVNAFPHDTIVCPGQQVQFTSNVNIQNCGLTLPCTSNLLSGVVGAGTGSQPGGPVTSPTLMGNFYKSGRNQMIYYANELQAALGGASTLKTISFNLSTFNTNTGLDNFTISVACTTQDSITTWNNNLTPVFTTASYTPLSGWNNIGLTSAFNWDGMSNIIVDVCWYNSASFGNQNNKAEVTPTTNTSTYLYTGLNVDECGTATAPQLVSNLRPNIRFNYCVPDITTFNIAWSPSTGPDSVSNPSIENPTVNPVNTTNYSIKVSDVQCAGSAAIIVQVDTSTVHVAQRQISSCPGQLQNLSASVTGTVLPGPGYTLTWSTVGGSPSGTGNSITVNPTTTTSYVVAMTGGACTKYDTTTVTIVGLNITMDTVNVTCNGYCNGKLYAIPNNGTAPYNYGWTGGVSNVDSAINLCPANQYNVTVTDMNGCTGTGSGQVTQPTALTVVIDTIQLVSCANGNNGSLKAVPAGGTGSYAYSWSDNLPSTQTVSSLSAGSYSLTVTDSLQCTASSAATISQPAPISFGAPFLQGTRCAGLNTGIITISPTGGNGNGVAANYTYSWCCNVVAMQSATNLAAGTYTVTVKDAQQCSGSASYTIGQPAALGFLPPAVTSTTCYNGTDGSAMISPYGGTPLTGPAPYTYLWTPSAETTNPATALSAQTYIAQVTDDSGCVAFDTLTVQQPLQIQITALITNASCNDSSTGAIATTTINGQQPYNYNWSSPLNAPNSPDLSNIPAGPYMVTVTDANQCTGSNTFMVSQPPALSFNPPAISNVSCNGGDNGVITASPLGGAPPYQYNWFPSGDSSTIGQLYAGIYSLTISDLNNCVDTISYTVSQPSSPLALSTPAVINVLCNGSATGSVTANVTGGTIPYNYLWSNGQTTNPTTSDTAGIYQLTVTDANQCTVSSFDTITQPQPLVFGPAAISNPPCNGQTDGIVLLNVSGGTQPYAFTANGMVWSNPQINVAAGTYVVVVTDANSCTNTQTVQVHAPAAVVVTDTIQNDPCYGDNGGYVRLFVQGGNPPYQYTWLPAPTDQNTDTVDAQLIAGTYAYTVTDDSGCSVSGQAVVSQPPPFFYSLDSTQESCPGADDGTITVTATGGTPPYKYAATQGSSNFIFTPDSVIVGLDTGYYEVQMSDANGCTYTSNIYIPGPVPDSFNAIVDTVSCYGGIYNDGEIQITGLVTQNTPYQFSVDSGAYQYSGNFTDLSAGRHVITAMNNFGCLSTIDTVVPQPVQAFTTVYPGDTSIALGQSAQLSSGFTPYPLWSITNYNWIPSFGLSCVDCPNPVATPYSEMNKYILTISYVAIDGGQTCTASDSLTIEITNHQKIFIPNVFSPNGDGNNDLFTIYGDDIKTVDLTVFNRWGEKIFESTDEFNGWDGTYKGQMQSVGTYVYQVKVTFLDDTQLEKAGSITLVR